jgi:hypothetical protein
MKDKQMSTALIAGVLSGVAGLLVFLVIHHFWIRPIWFIMPVGLVVAAVGGLAVGWAYAEIRAGLPARPWTSPAVFALIGATLIPALVLNISLGTIPPGATGRVIVHVVAELLLTAPLIGAVLGWRLGHTGRAALATALAGLIFAIGPGHNIPLLASTPAAGKGAVLLVAIVLVSTVVLVEGQAWLASRSF